MDIASFIRHVPDYPKPGILFYDITPLLASPEAFGDVIERMADAARPLRPTRIVAAEARGFLFAAPLAQRLGVGLAPVRKPGKLPCEAFEASYDLEYGSNTLCLHKDALTPEDRVLIVDDMESYSHRWPVPDVAFLVASPKLETELKTLVHVNPKIRVVIYTLEFSFMSRIPGMLWDNGIKPTEVMKLEVSKLGRKDEIEVQPAPWIFSGQAGLDEA